MTGECETSSSSLNIVTITHLFSSHHELIIKNIQFVLKIIFCSLVLQCTLLFHLEPLPGLTVLGLTDGCYKRSIPLRQLFEQLFHEENTIGQTEDGQTVIKMAALNFRNLRMANLI